MDESTEEILREAENALSILSKNNSYSKPSTADLVKIFCVLMSTSTKPDIAECIRSAKDIYAKLNEN